MKIIQNYRNEIVSNGIFYHFLDEHIRKDWGYHVRQNIEFLESHNIFQNINIKLNRLTDWIMYYDSKTPLCYIKNVTSINKNSSIKYPRIPTEYFFDSSDKITAFNLGNKYHAIFCIIYKEPSEDKVYLCIVNSGYGIKYHKSLYINEEKLTNLWSCYEIDNYYYYNNVKPLISYLSNISHNNTDYEDLEMDLKLFIMGNLGESDIKKSWLLSLNRHDFKQYIGESEFYFPILYKILDKYSKPITMKKFFYTVNSKHSSDYLAVFSEQWNSFKDFVDNNESDYRFI